MLSRKRVLFLIPVLSVALACQAVMGLWQALPTTTPTAALILPTQTLLPTPSPTVALTLSPPAATATLILTPTSQPTASPEQLQVFEDLWATVNENYLYPDFNGLDWDAIHEEYRLKIEAGLSSEDFYLAMAEMIHRLGDEHSAFFSPEDAREVDAEYAGDYNFVGIGIMTVSVPERQRITIIAVFPDSPAEQAGLQIHDSILTADGQPIMGESGYRRDLLRGPEGSTLALTVQTPGQEPRPVSVVRQRVSGALPVFHQVLTTPSGKRVGYMLLLTFNDSTVDDQVETALRNMSSQSPLDGLIIDNRMNGGGSSNIFRNVLAYFTKGTLGHFVQRESERALRVSAKNLQGSQKLPLAVLIGPDTASFGEIFSGILKDIGRAYLIGEQTDGNVEILSVYNFSDGSRAWIAEETFRPLKHPEQDWEKTGIIPDLSVITAWDEVTLATDPAVQAALRYFDELPVR